MPIAYQRILPGLPMLAEPTYAAWPCWADSTPKPVEFTPLPKKSAVKLWHRAREFDRQTKQPGKHGGAVGHTALTVLQVLLFDFLNFRSGRLDPSKGAIAKKANLSETAVATALDRLRDLGILTWLRRCDHGWCNGRYWRRQLTNAYAILESGWRGYRPPPEPPAPMRCTWAPERMPSILEAAEAARQTGGPKAQVQVLQQGLYGGLEAALARLGQVIEVRGKI